MKGFVDLFSSEKGIMTLIVLCAATGLLLAGAISPEMWASVTGASAGTYQIAKAWQGAATAKTGRTSP